MATAAASIHALLAGSTALTDVLTGGVHTRTLDREGTPTAFDDNGRPLPAAVVRDLGEDADPTGKDTAFAGFPQVWFQAPATDAGRAAIESAWEIARSLIPAQVAGPNGTGAAVKVVGRVAVDDDPAIPGVVIAMLRLQVAGLWAAGR
jgi:hypothetical protein